MSCMYRFDKEGEKEKLVKRISEGVGGHCSTAECNLFRLLRPGEELLDYIEPKDVCAEYNSFEYVMNGSLQTQIISTSSDVKGISSFIADNVIFCFQKDCQLKQHVMYIAVIQRDLLKNYVHILDLKDKTCREEIINDHFKHHTEYYEGYVQKFNEITNEFSEAHVSGIITRTLGTSEMYKIFSMTVIRDSHAYVIVCNPVNLINTARAQPVIPAQPVILAQPVIPAQPEFPQPFQQFPYSLVNQPYYPQY